MPRSRRRVARRRKRLLANLPPRYIGGRRIPPELDVLVPVEDPYCYLTTREAVHDLALEAMRVAPPVRHVALTCDVLGGVHDVRSYEADEGLTLLEVADIEHAALRTFPLPLALIYFERGVHPPADAEARWDELVRIHRDPPFVVDVLVVSPEDHLVFSYAQRFGPDPWSPEMAARCRIDVQAAEIRQRLGLDD